MRPAESVPVSAREAEVLTALADRLTNKEIAGRLVVSVRTVETHVASLLRKFGVASRRDLADIAKTRDGPRRLRPLPAPLTLFIGREAELARVAALCTDHRLVTVVGPAGVGKTRLAVEFARLADIPAAFVECASRQDSTGLWRATAEALALDEEPRPLPESVVDRLRDPTLLVLDNCEHLLDDAADLVCFLVDSAPAVKVLITSREPLGIPGEQVVALSPLDVPPEDQAHTADEIGSHPSVQLFVDRAVSTSATFRLDDASAPTVAAICRRLDGIPLALELAAAQLPALTAQQIDERLGDRFRLLRAPRRGAAATRHTALDGALEWSWDLLDARERALLDRLGIFRGSFTLAAAEAVVSGAPVDSADVVDLLVGLVRKSLVGTQDDGGEHRFRLLETMREFAWRRLRDAGELPLWRDRHRDWMFERMRTAAEALSCGVVPEWLDVLDRDLDNMAAALEWSFESSEGAALALPVVRGLEHYWMARGIRRAQGVRWSTTAAERATGVAPAARVESLLGAVLLVMWSDLHAARVLADQAAKLAEASGDDVAAGYAALAGAWVAMFRGDVDEAEPLALSAADLLDRTDPISSWASMAMGILTGCRGDVPAAARLVRDAAEEFFGHDDAHMAGAALTLAADYRAAVGDLVGARQDVSRGLDEAAKADCASCESQAHCSAALVAVDPADRLRSGRRSVELAAEINEPWGVLSGVEVTAAALAETGAWAEAAVLAGAVRAARERLAMAPILPGRTAALERAEATCREGLGPGTFADLTADGAVLDYAQMVLLAVG